MRLTSELAFTVEWPPVGSRSRPSYASCRRAGSRDCSPASRRARSGCARPHTHRAPVLLDPGNEPTGLPASVEPVARVHRRDDLRDAPPLCPRESGSLPVPTATIFAFRGCAPARDLLRANNSVVSHITSPLLEVDGARARASRAGTPVGTPPSSRLVACARHRLLPATDELDFSPWGGARAG